jgi:hypothetical protein
MTDIKDKPLKGKEGQAPDFSKPEFGYLFSTKKKEGKGLTDEQFKLTRPKISIALSKNLTFAQNDTALRSIKEGYEFKLDSDPQLIRRNRPCEIDKKGMQLIFALNIYMAKWGNDEEIRNYIRIVSEEGREPALIPTRPINLQELTGLIYDNNGKREREQEEVYTRLKKLSETMQKLIFRGRKYDDEEGTYNTVLDIEEPILGSIGSIIKIRNEETGEIVRIVQITFSRIFFQNLTDKFTPILPSILVIRDEKGKIINNSELFWSLASLLHAERWRFVTIGYSTAKKKAEEDYKGIKNWGERKKAIEAAAQKGLIYTISFEDIKKSTSANYSHHKREKDFMRDLETSIKALKIYGIIEKGSRIDKEGNRAIFVFNIHFATVKRSPLLSGEPAEDILSIGQE